MLDGGIEGRPDNVLFYATSNRRHLMPRDMIENERSTAINPSEAIEEKVSLSDRFGIWLGFHNCDQDTYFAMVEGYAASMNLPISVEDLRAKAVEWSMTRGARSGRVAWQCIQDVAGQLGARDLTRHSYREPKIQRPARMTSPAHQNGEQDGNASSPPVADHGDSWTERSRSRSKSNRGGGPVRSRAGLPLADRRDHLLRSARARPRLSPTPRRTAAELARSDPQHLPERVTERGGAGETEPGGHLRHRHASAVQHLDRGPAVLILT